MPDPVCIPKALHKRAKQLLEIMNSSSKLDNLKILGSPPDIKLHKLSGNFKNYWRLTLNRSYPWRIIFIFSKGEFIDVEITDYH